MSLDGAPTSTVAAAPCSLFSMNSQAVLFKRYSRSQAVTQSLLCTGELNYTFVIINTREFVVACVCMTQSNVLAPYSRQLTTFIRTYNYGRTLSDASMLYFADVFFSYFFMTALVGQTAERIFTKLSHVVDIRCYLRTY